MYEKVCSLKCQFKIVMNNRKAVTILHVRLLQVTSQIQRKRTNILLSTSDSNAESETFHNSSAHSHMAEIATHFSKHRDHFIIF
jgi:hypothetical protein